MRIPTIPRESVEKLEVTISVRGVDPTTLPVEFSFTQGEARPTVWTAGTWEGGSALCNDVYVATALTPLIGAGALDLAPGSWLVWTRLDSVVEDPVMPALRLKIT